MGIVREATISTFNEFIDTQRAEPGACDVALTLFDTRFDVRHTGDPIDRVVRLTEHNYQPSGMTALHDAVGKTIDEVGQRLAAMHESQRPGKVVFVVQTDGEENSSREYTGDQVRQMIKHQEERYQWVFTFLGANQDAWANSLGIARGNTISYDNTAKGVRQVVNSASAGISAYRRSAGGQSVTVYGDDAVDLRQDKDDDDS
jgi:hypothetical protein